MEELSRSRSRVKTQTKTTLQRHRILPRGQSRLGHNHGHGPRGPVGCRYPKRGGGPSSAHDSVGPLTLLTKFIFQNALFSRRWWLRLFPLGGSQKTVLLPSRLSMVVPCRKRPGDLPQISRPDMLCVPGYGTKIPDDSAKKVAAI